MGQYQIIQLLRGIFTLFIVIYHFSLHHDQEGYLLPLDHPFVKFAEPLSLSVYAFFMFSAFVVPLGVYGAEYSLSKFPAFMLRRIIRLQIPYLASMLCIILFDALWASKAGLAYHFDFEKLMANFLYVAPFTGHDWYNIIYWSLCVEFQLYVLIGVLMPFLEHAPKIRLIPFLALFALLPIFFDQHLNVLKYAAVFNFGFILLLYHKERLKSIEAAGLFFISALVIFVSMRYEILVIVTLCTLLIHVFKTKPIPAASIGEMSYSLYLMHGLTGGFYLIIRFELGINHLHWIFHFLTALAIAIFCSWLFWMMIEKPAHRLARKVKLRTLNESRKSG
jgi:peptidoglycan/LPS O-acetylase OafA/YrhL